MLSDELLAEGWLPHDGGPCPVHSRGRPGVLFADGEIIQPGKVLAAMWEIDPTNWWQWKQSDPCDRIIAYKPEKTDG